ncbi:hypothetical protein SCHPADRAFT_978959, partial [Schizopora paradoxa]
MALSMKRSTKIRHTSIIYLFVLQNHPKHCESMSLSGLFAKKSAGLDNDLDTIFQSSAGPSTSLFTVSNSAASSKEASNSVTKKKRRGSEGQESHKKKVRVDTTLASEKNSSPEKSSSKVKSAKVPKTSAVSEKPTEDSVEDAEETRDEDGSESDSSQVPVHESLTKKAKKSSRKLKFSPEDETSEQRDARTIFVGNLPAEIAKNRSLSKKLKRHITEHVPRSSIESIRFRSVPFQNPTSKLDSDDKKPPPKKEEVSERDQREQKRTADWREKQKKGADDEVKEDEKKYMTPGQKRRLAFIKG